MRDTMLGRWAARLAVTVGVGAAALGISAAAAHASEYSARPVQILITHGLVVDSGANEVPADPTYMVEDYSWM